MRQRLKALSLGDNYLQWELPDCWMSYQLVFHFIFIFHPNFILENWNVPISIIPKKRSSTKIIAKKIDASKLWSWVLEGILPIKLLLDKFKWLNNVKLDMLCGIAPESWFTEKSTDSNALMVPIPSGIIPLKVLKEKFIDCNAFKICHFRNNLSWEIIPGNMY